MTKFTIEQLKAHAVEHYNDKKARWDVIVECWEDKDFEDAIARGRTFRGTLKVMKDFARFQWDRAMDQGCGEF